ncbi:polycystic kidney disease 1 like 1 [Lampris incognitus]|uniref:polycystic kidney disease 1 like 1 n=1 Tax=Lampris incognitus TaxID=2546036 RepID=UPI0024B527B9|nr:polycystic kidney disease 1 like 1 [Lampris incognitus]
MAGFSAMGCGHEDTPWFMGFVNASSAASVRLYEAVDVSDLDPECVRVLQAGVPFIMEVSGSLAGDPRKPTDVTVSNPVSKLSSILNLSVLRSSPEGLVISLLHGRQGAPSCVPSQYTVSESGNVEAAYLGDSVTLQAVTSGGLIAELFRWFTQRKTQRKVETEEREVIRSQSSTALSVGQDISVQLELFTTIRQLLLFNLKLKADKEHIYGRNDDRSRNGNDSTDSDNTSGKTNHGNGHTSGSVKNSQSDNNDHKNHYFIRKQDNSYDHSLSQHHSNNNPPDKNVFCMTNIIYNQSHGHDGVDRSNPSLFQIHTQPLAADPLHFSPVHLIHSPSSCHLHLHLPFQLPTIAGHYQLSVYVSSMTDPSSVLLSTDLPHALVVYDHIQSLWPSRSWRTVVPTQSDLHLEVMSHANRMESGTLWTVILNGDILVNRTTEDWNTNMSLQIAGCYQVTVKAFNPVSWALFTITILAQIPVGELMLTVPSVVQVKQPTSIWFTITAGSNMTVALLVNGSMLYQNTSYTTEEEAEVVLLFDHSGIAEVWLRADNMVSSKNRSISVCVRRSSEPLPPQSINTDWPPPTSQSLIHNLDVNAVRIYTAKQTYPTNTDITFLVKANVSGRLKFLWSFTDSRYIRTTSTTITTRFRTPGRYSVTVTASNSRRSFLSEPFPLVIQRAVRINRLVHPASVLLNRTTALRCRVNAGTNLTYLWNFGDGTFRRGWNTEHHIFHRVGEFTVEVTVFNLVSSASLSSQIFVVDRPCQPPPVKNIGPPKIQVWRYEVVRLGVTYESDIDCDMSWGLHYTWTLYNSTGQAFPLPYIETHRQSITLPSHLLHYDTYTAVARVQVVGSVVYSVYTVRVEVVPSPPVAFIQGGTNSFINIKKIANVTLDGQLSYDPDFPTNPLSYSWSCKPVSAIISSCFDQYVPASLSILTFPISSLKPNFDQFRFTLTIHSREYSVSTETFLTITPNLFMKVSAYCLQCHGEHINSDKAFSVSAEFQSCGVGPKHIQYSWSLFLVNASSKPIIEVPFCQLVDLSAPSNVIEDPAAPYLPLEASLLPPDTMHTSFTWVSDPSVSLQTSQDTHRNHTSVPIQPSKNGATSTALRRMQHLNLMGGSDDIIKPENPSRNGRLWKRTLANYEGPARKALADQTENTTASPMSSSKVVGVLASSEPYYPHRSSPFSSTDKTKALVAVVTQIVFQGHNLIVWDLCIKTESFIDADYDIPFLGVEEGDSGFSEGRPTGLDGESFVPKGEPEVHLEPGENEGSNLVDPRPSVGLQELTLLDLPRELVETGVFESYTYTGTSSPLISFKPFSLKPGSRYMMEVTAKSHNSFLGRTQLFLKTNPAPRGVTCQVQPSKGMEMHTHFSIFCTSGKEDLLYEYSFGIGDKPRRTLYQGRDFQYYFSLPSGDPDDHYKVTIYIEIRSSGSGAVTKPCPVTVQVQPCLRTTSSPHEADLELSESGLRNLSALVQLGNSVEICNYISLLSSILNRLSLDSVAITRVQMKTRSVLISTVCELEITDQVSMFDHICILRDLVQVPQQVTLSSAKQVTDYIQAISERFADPAVPVLHYLDQGTVNTLVTLLSYCLQAAAATDVVILETFNNDDITQTAAGTDYLTPDSSNGKNITHAKVDQYGKSYFTDQVAQLATSSLQTAADLLLRYFLFSGLQEHSINTSIMALHTTYQNQGLTSTIVSSSLTTFYLPGYLRLLLFSPDGEETGNGQHQQPCVLSQLSVFSQNPYFWANTQAQLNGPIVDLSFYRCSTRRKIPLVSLPQPVNIEFQQPPRNNSSMNKYIFLRSQINYHSLNITQQYLQQAIQLSVTFMPPPTKTFPIMLLFRMFERPTPSLYHLQRTYQWEANTIHITLPPSYLSVAGVGYLALLNADYGKPSRHKYQSKQVSYSLTFEASLCLSWDGHQGTWTDQGCATQQGETSAAVNCSCNQLRSLTVIRQHIQTNNDTTGLDQYLSVANDLTVVGVLVVCVCLYVLGLGMCRRADVVSEKNGRVHYLSDNCPTDPFLYTVTIRTGLCSAASMTARVYMVLYGENGVSQTRELQVPECPIFRRNSQDTFILSAADSLGELWGILLWHDNSGPSPRWYLQRVEVSEISRGHGKVRSWLFLGQCWLAVGESDGCVERQLRVCTQALGFAKLLHFHLWDYLADFHLWVSVYSHHSPSSFTHTQRLSICLLLLLGYMCVNALVISKMEEQWTFELGFIDVSAVSLKTGVLSVLVVLPAAIMVSFLFCLREVEPGFKSSFLHSYLSFALLSFFSDSHLPWNGLQLWAQEAWGKKQQSQDLVSDKDEEAMIQIEPITQREKDLSNQGSPDLGLQGLTTQGDTGDLITLGKEKDLINQGRINVLNSRSVGSPVIKTDNRTSVSVAGKDLVLQKDLMHQHQQLTRGRDKNQIIPCDKDPVTQMVTATQTNMSLMIQEDTDPVTQVIGSSNSSGFEDGHHNPSRMLGSSDGSDRCHHQEEYSDCSCGSQAKCSLRRVRGITRWCHYLGWLLCLLLSIACLVLTAVFGTRFCSGKVLLWTHSLFFSLLSCIFLIQPALIFIVAAGVSFWYRERRDFYHFSITPGCNIEALKLLSQDSAYQPNLQHSPLRYPQEKYLHFEKLLVARKRARYLRLVRPPSPAELRKIRAKKRKETLIHKTLREWSISVSMLLLMLCINNGSFSTDQYQLNKDVRVQFTSDPHNSFLSIGDHNDWWTWTQTSLLDVLYKKASTTTKAHVVQRAHILIGEPVLWKVEVANSSQCWIPSAMADMTPDCLSVLWSEACSNLDSAVVLNMAASQQVCSHFGCYSGPNATVGLGRTRDEALSRLRSLHSGSWLSRQTVAVKVQITLYTPAANLFTSVTLLTVQSPTGILLPSAAVQSARIHHNVFAWDYIIMVCQLLFLLITLLQLCHQVCSAGQQGLMGYLRTPCNCLEVSLLLVILVYYIYYICHSVIIFEVVDLLLRHNYREHVDISLLASCQKHICTLRGLMLFLLSIRCVGLLRVHRVTATSAIIFQLSLSSLVWPMVLCLILVVGLSCLGNLLFIQRSWAFRSIPVSLQTLLSHYRGLRGFTGLRGFFLSGQDPVQSPASLSETIYHGALCLTSTLLWTAVPVVVVSSVVKAAKRTNRRRDVVTLSEIAIYIRDKLSALLGQKRLTRTDIRIARRDYYFEEFEILVDELLFRLNTLNDSLHHTLPPKVHHYREHTSSVSPIQRPPSLCSALSINWVMKGEMTLNGSFDTCLSHSEEHSSASHLLRSQVGFETIQCLQQRLHRQNSFYQDQDVISDGGSLQTSDRSEGNQTKYDSHHEDGDPRTSLGGQTCLFLPVSLTGAGTGGHQSSGWSANQLVQNMALTNQISHLTKTADSGWLSSRACKNPRSQANSHLHRTDIVSVAQATRHSRTAVVVEVMVHEIPQREEFENLQDPLHDLLNPEQRIA